MIDIFDLMQSVAILTFAVIGYILIFQKSGHKKNGHYSVPGWTTFIKKYWAERQLKIKQNQHKFRELSDFNYFKNERIKIAENERNSDSHMIYGSDQDGNSLLIKCTKRNEGNAEVWLILRLKTGMVYTLPDHPNTNIVSTSMPFECDGLRIEHIIHFKALRITFNGLLRSGIRSSWSNDYGDSELRFVKFHFIWSAAAPPQHFPNDWSLQLRSLALASEPWRSGNWLNYLSTPDFGGYDQFGAFLGQVFIDDRNLSQRTDDTYEMECFELNLPGIRQRRCLPFYSENQRRNAYIYGVGRDGTVFVIGASSYVDSMTHLPFGYVRTSNGKTHPISWTNFHLMHLAEDPTSIAPKAITFQFKANKKMYSTIVHFLKKSFVPLVGENHLLWRANIIPVELGINGEQGLGSAVLWYSNPNRKYSLLKDASKFYLTPTLTKPDNRLTFMFSEMEAKSLLVSGGKGSSLALLSSTGRLNLNHTEAEFEVPPGFVVSVSAFDLQLRRNPNLVKHINSIRDVAHGIVEGRLQDVCELTVQEFKATPLEKEIVVAVTKYYEQIAMNTSGSKDLRFAVRSSAIGEDSDDASAAGQNETFLGLRNMDETLESIKLCWASLFTYQSVEYRRQHIQPINSAMSVVVQLMVPSDSAGVLFTRHPASGDPSKILITANYGLGETVVSGAVDPDTYVVYRRYKTSDLTILEKKIGSKQHYLYMSSSSQGDNVVQDNILDANQGKSCLSDEQILRLSNIGVHIEKLYGNARDIEWAIHENKIYLLQCRPITTLNSYTNWELLHELDTPIMSPDDFTTFGNVGEVFPEVISPLTLSTIATILNRSTSEAMTKEKDFYDGVYSVSFITSNYRSTIDVFKCFLPNVDNDITMQNKILTISVCGHDIITPEMHRIGKNRNGIATRLQKLAVILDILQSIWSNKSKVKIMENLVRSTKGRYSKHNLAEFNDCTARQFNAQIEFEIDDEDRLSYFFATHSHISKVSVFYQIISMVILAEGGKEITTEHYADFALMLGFIPVESAEVPRMLKEIVDDIYLNGKLDEFVNISSRDGVEWLEVNCKSAAMLVKDFILKHGHRSLKEYDLASKTWEMEPEQIIAMVQASCRSSKDISVQKKDKVELTNNEIIKRLKIPKSNVTRKIISFLLPLCKDSVQNREASKSGLITFINEIRKAYLHLADLMFREGLLPNKELLFYLTRYELSELLRKPSTNGKPVNKSGIINKAMRRMKLFPTWNTYRFQQVNRGIIKPINEQDNLYNDGNKTVTGTPVCEGIVTARACVIKDFSEVSKIKTGDILVTYSTDIGWSPYFPLLGGIVTELGGVISHGAVVAREYGLPCIVGAMGATTILKYGDRITLNAASKTWEMEPEQIIAMVQASCRSSKDISVQKKEKVELTNNEIIKRLKIPKSNVTRQIISFLLPLCKESVQYREASKSGLITFTNEIRKAYLHLADLMFREGLLPNKELLFYLTRYELSELLGKPSTNGKPVNKSGIINKAMRRMKLFPTWNTYRFQQVNRGIIKPINEQDNLCNDGNKTVTGTPVCEGIVTARACVIKDFSEVSKIKTGDILVTYSTDIGWSPYFPLLGGIVTELGGIISHGAVVAREYGLPCIVGAMGATTILKYGDRITLNAGKGFIVKVEEIESSFGKAEMEPCKA